MKSKERRFLKVDLAILVFVACIWVESATTDINSVNAAVRDANTIPFSITDVNSIKPKPTKNNQAAQGQSENPLKTQNDLATSTSKKTIAPAMVAKPISLQPQSPKDGTSEKVGSPDKVEFDIQGRCKIERDRNGNLRSITLGGYTSSDKQKIDQYNNDIQKIKNNDQLTDFEKNKAILKIHSAMVNILPSEKSYNNTVNPIILEIKQNEEKQRLIAAEERRKQQEEMRKQQEEMQKQMRIAAELRKQQEILDAIYGLRNDIDDLNGDIQQMPRQLRYGY